ncbi:hypothetical protein AW27_007520 [Streptomyces sp. PCS3-D2]|uniref:hypothetical protein n=1 Tax=Streptomyces sp. PCS3-D2 TaxID=1460244 RepID=UPI00068E8463|nr:hypothetical protein [Streptomyces sp. PCS3-D2]WKV71390.1 hypothetical protein AW27_007520 [Streptomyces sp. PCS3-D2]
MLWSSPRLICIAEDFTRYDVHAVRETRRTIDLVRYSFFGTGLLALEPVAKVTATPARSDGQRPAGAWVRRGRQQRRPQAVPRVPRLRNFACVSHARQIGHHGTGDVEVRMRSEADLLRAEPLLRMSYEAA